MNDNTTSTVLVTDDEDTTRDMLRRILVKEGYQIELAANGFECLEKVKKGNIDIVLLDVTMDGIDGIETLQRIKKIDSYLPVIMVTGTGDNTANIESVKLGADAYVAKPYDPTDLRSMVKEILLTKGKKIKEGGEGLPNIEKILTDESRNTILSLIELIELKNPYTREHSKQVAKYAVLIAKEMEFPEKEIEIIKQAALIHDIGKVGISDMILDKPGKLTEEEYKAVKEHPALGVKALKHLRLLQIEVAMIRHHHERWDGKGYPAGLKGEEIPIVARILAVADTYDAMRSNRAYRQARSLDYAISELKDGAGTQFDPKVVEAFLKVSDRETQEKK